MTTQARIALAHHAAAAEMVAYMEREVAATRTGATVWDHTHVVISNKVQTLLDGKWRSLDGRPMHEAVVALSELHGTLFADVLTRSLGVKREMRERGPDRHPAWAISFVPEAPVAEFSSRSRTSTSKPTW